MSSFVVLTSMVHLFYFICWLDRSGEVALWGTQLCTKRFVELVPPTWLDTLMQQTVQLYQKHLKYIVFSPLLQFVLRMWNHKFVGISCYTNTRISLFNEQVLQRVIGGVEKFGFRCQGWIQSPITGAEGNIEFLACFHRLPSSTASCSTDMNQKSNSDDTSEHDETELT